MVSVSKLTQQVKLLSPVVKLNEKLTLPLSELLLTAGSAVIIPTETCYGIAADATSEKAVARVYNAKQRSDAKQITIIVDSLVMARKYLQLTPLAVKLSKAHHPGPLTIIVRRKAGSKLAKNLSRTTVGFRIPANKLCLDLIRACKVPLTATSANLAGEPANYSIKTMPRALLQEVDLVIDAGKLQKRAPSTIVDCTGSIPKVIRQGALRID